MKRFILLIVVALSFAHVSLGNSFEPISIADTAIVNQNGDTLLQYNVINSIDSIQKDQKKIKRNVYSLIKLSNQQDYFIHSSLDSLDAGLSAIKDSVFCVSSSFQQRISEVQKCQQETISEIAGLKRTSTIYVCIIAALLLLVLFMIFMMARFSRYIMVQDKEKHADQHKCLDVVSKHDSDSKNMLHEIVAAISKCTEKVLARLPVSSEINSVAYNAAVDAWIYINNHLDSLGRYRRRIPEVYKLLAGYQVDESVLNEELVSIDNDERRGEISVIISDIHRFMLQHREAIEKNLSVELGTDTKLQDAVRYPLGKPFSNDLDSEITGDQVPDGAIISMVGSLGYHFPGSRNGCYRVKSRVSVN